VIAQTPFPDPWAFQAHPEVWLLVAFLAGSYVYMVRVIGPGAVAAGTPVVTGRQTGCFVLAMALLWFGADWPVHDLGEEYLYSVHMFQHMLFSYLVPPLALFATPTWMARVLLGTGRTYRIGAFASKAVVAGVVFNLMVMITHIPGVVNASVDNGLLHYTLHFFLVVTALLMWVPVCGPVAEWQIGPGAKCIYLFLMSVVPTVPAGWLTFAEGVVYRHYEQPVRVWGISVTDDQQIAGAIMKLGGSAFLWGIVVFLFFKRFGAGFDRDTSYVRPRDTTGTLTFDDVTRAFERSEPPLLEAERGASDERRHERP
jgi:putative membrane protein